MRLPTLYNTLDELNLDMQILGKVLQVPSQSLEDLTFTLKEEMKIKNPLPTLEKRRYKISDQVSDDYEITYKEELQLAENEECVNLSLENIEINESEPIVSVTPEYKAYFRYENHATPSMLEEFLSGDTTRFNGNISQLGTTELKKDLELSDNEIEQLSTTNETWGSDGLDFDATTSDKIPEQVFEVGTDDVEYGEDEPTFDVNTFTTGDEDDVSFDASGITTEEQVYSTEDTSTPYTNNSIGGIDFIENKTLTNLDTYFTIKDNTTIHLNFIENMELDNLDEVVDLSYQEYSSNDTENESCINFIENIELDNLDDVVELSYQDEQVDDSDEDFDTDEDFEDQDDDFEDDEDFDTGMEDEDFDTDTSEDSEEDEYEGEDGFDTDMQDNFEDDEFDTVVPEQIETVEDIDFGTDTEETSEMQGGIEETTVSDEDLGFIDTSTPEDLDFGSSTVTNNTEDDAYINKILSNKSLPEALKKELIQDYLKTQSKGAVEVDLGTETVQETVTKKEEIPHEEAVEYKDIRHFVRDHPRCTVQDVLKHFSKKQLEHDIMVGKVIRKGKILHI